MEQRCAITNYSSSSSPDGTAKFLFNFFAASWADFLGLRLRLLTISFSRGFIWGSPHSYGSQSSSEEWESKFRLDIGRWVRPFLRIPSFTDSMASGSSLLWISKMQKFKYKYKKRLWKTQWTKYLFGSLSSSEWLEEELSEQVSSFSWVRWRRAPTFEWINWEMLEFVGASDLPFLDFVSVAP